MRTLGLLVFVVAVSPLALFGAAKEEKPADGKAVEFKGVLQTGMMAIGGETTGTIISVKGGKTYELELGNLRELAEKLHGKEVVVRGTLRVKPGVEIRERRIITVTELKPAEKEKAPQ